MHRKRPPLKSSLSVQLTTALEERAIESVTDASCKRFPRKQSFQSSFSAPKEDEEFMLPDNVEDNLGNVILAKTKDKNANISDLNDVCGACMNENTDEQGCRKSQAVINAVISKNTDELRKRIEAGDDLEEEDKFGFKPLHYACKTGNLEAIKMLIEAGCDKSASNGDRITSLHVAVRAGNADVVALLLDEGVPADVTEKRKGRTAVHEAAILAKLAVLKVFMTKLQEDPWEAQRILRISDKEGHTALHSASSGLLTEAIGLLLCAGADVAAKDNEGLTPMHLALLSHRGKRRCGGVLTQLLDAGGDVEAAGGSGLLRLSHFAANVGCAICIEFLHQKGANLEAKDSLGRTPLHIATAESKPDAIKYLVSAKVDLEAEDDKGLRPMHFAVLSDCSQAIEALLQGGPDLTSKDADGRTYVQLAILRRKTNSFQAFVKLKASQLPEDSGEDLIHYCAALGFINHVTFLLENGWDINLKDSKGRTALHRSLNHGHEHLATLLINAGASLQETDDCGATPLHYAVRWGGSDAILRLLVKKKAMLAVRDRLGRTPLHYAASKFSIMSDLYILLGGGSALDSQDEMGLTPLHLAARLGNESLVRILLESGARPDLRDIDNFLPVDHALEKGHKCIIKRLMTHLKDGASQGYSEKKGDSRLEQHRKSMVW